MAIISGMRTASSNELAEIALVQQVTEAQAIANDAARVDMTLLNAVLAYESALQRLILPAVTSPATITVYDVQGGSTEVPNPAIAKDVQERAVAQLLIDTTDITVLDIYALRNPVPLEAQ